MCVLWYADCAIMCVQQTPGPQMDGTPVLAMSRVDVSQLRLPLHLLKRREYF